MWLRRNSGTSWVLIWDKEEIRKGTQPPLNLEAAVIGSSLPIKAKICNAGLSEVCRFTARLSHCSTQKKHMTQTLVYKISFQTNWALLEKSQTALLTCRKDMLPRISIQHEKGDQTQGQAPFCCMDNASIQASLGSVHALGHLRSVSSSHLEKRCNMIWLTESAFKRSSTGFREKQDMQNMSCMQKRSSLPSKLSVSMERNLRLWPLHRRILDHLDQVLFLSSKFSAFRLDIT